MWEIQKVSPKHEAQYLEELYVQGLEDSKRTRVKTNHRGGNSVVAHDFGSMMSDDAMTR